ncbi:MAG: excinuclease ABC subunit UvrC [Candidatus Rickettsiella isopodorum]|nr:excinuclease ABC subunit UvrC [Candidatus Rickettsiella isopodorum]
MVVTVERVHTAKLKQQLAFISQSAGVYLFLNAEQQVLYVGKARHLKKRITSYFRGQQSSRVALLMRQVTTIETTSTETENQALLLESNLIKQLKPRYNILLRDDKSYPYIILSKHQSYPRLAFYRGARAKDYRYFGPFPSILAVRETLNLLQKLFRVRSCKDSFFRNRTRPCLQYQIKRCTGPCVGLITPENYQRDVTNTVLFLQGKNQTVIDDIAEQMELSAQDLDYETAARLRDQIAALREIQQKQVITTGQGNLDIIGLAQQTSHYVLYVMNVRHGRLLGGKAYFPDVPLKQSAAEVLSAFISQFYCQTEVSHTIPEQIILPLKVPEQDWLMATLTERSKHKVKLLNKPSGEKKHWLSLANENARHALVAHLSDKWVFYKQLECLQTTLQLDNLPQRLECFDISHTQGEATVASCVVFDQQGPRKMDYRRFNIEGIIPGDDYAAMRQAMMRRYKYLKNEEENLPDILLIDGGKGQLKQAEQVLEELQISGILIIGVAKGPRRRSGLESLYLSSRSQAITLPADSLALHAILTLRDQAHRFAVTGHRGRRAKKRRTSVLEDIPGIGTKRRRELLRQFGGLQALQNASAADLAKVPGISKRLAEQIYLALKA